MIDEPLLDAVDALTKPIPRAVMIDDTHEHDWLAVKTIRPAAEVRALRKAGDKNASREIHTGEWWCPWCDTTVTTIDRTPPSSTVVRQEDAPLLEQLEEAVANGREAAGGSQRPNERTPIAVGALDLVLEIRATVNGWLVDLGDTTRPADLVSLVRHWYAASLAHQPAPLVGVLRGWERRIRNMLYPVQHEEIVGICPRCEFAFVLLDDARKRALQGTNGDTYDRTRVECLVCGADWSGWDQLHELANATRRLDGQPELESRPFVG